jgi:hypothetical protein
MQFFDSEILRKVATLPRLLAQYAYAALLHEKAHAEYLLQVGRLAPSRKIVKKRIKRTIDTFYLDSFYHDLLVLHEWETSSEHDEEMPRLYGKGLDADVEQAIDHIEQLISEGGVGSDDFDNDTINKFDRAWDAYLENAQMAIDLFQRTRFLPS